MATPNYGYEKRQKELAKKKKKEEKLKSKAERKTGDASGDDSLQSPEDAAGIPTPPAANPS
ncbi:hypothetical protein [Rhodoferax sp. GW822-FHT02A01]|uniref:hypothetical protein n=1 Tax=Rhodoferax sp. GW822-FHT02A01 TaxID=3141537 RepID=UPI00315D8E46